MKSSRLATSGGVRRHTIRRNRKITKAALVGGAAAAAIAAAVSLAPSASASVFTVCPSGNAGVVGGHTSCAFAENVQRVFWASGANRFVAYSPVTGERYVMTCGGLYTAYFDTGAVRTTTHCGGTNAEVVVW